MRVLSLIQLEHDDHQLINSLLSLFFWTAKNIYINVRGPYKLRLTGIKRDATKCPIRDSILKLSRCQLRRYTKRSDKPQHLTCLKCPKCSQSLRLYDLTPSRGVERARSHMVFRSQVFSLIMTKITTIFSQVFSLVATSTSSLESPWYCMFPFLGPSPHDCVHRSLWVPLLSCPKSRSMIGHEPCNNQRTQSLSEN